MADTKISALPAVTSPLGADVVPVVSGGVTSKVQIQNLHAGSKYPADGRLTLTTAVPVTTADVTAATTLYYTPYSGDQIALYNGTAWDILTFTEISITNAGLAASKPYDVFCYNNSGTAALELLVWTNDTTRATALVMQNGILCKTGALTRRYLGTIRTDAASKFNDSVTLRNVANYYNRKPRGLFVRETSSHTYTTASWRGWNNGTAAQVFFVSCNGEDDIWIEGITGFTCNGNVAESPYTNVGLDSTTVAVFADNIHYVGLAIATYSVQLALSGRTIPAAGYHYLSGMEYGSANSAQYLAMTVTAQVWG